MRSEILSRISEIEGISLDEAIKKIGSEDTYLNVLSLTAELMPENIANLNMLFKGLKEDNTEGISRYAIEAHGLNGVLKTIGANDLGEKLRQLEVAAFYSDLTVCRALHPKMIFEFTALSEKLWNILFSQKKYEYTQNAALTYDIGMLSKIDDFDYEMAMKKFVSYGVYFNELEKFIREAGKFFSGYSPVAVISSDKIREEFNNEADALKRRFIDLGILTADSDLNDLKITASKSDHKSLSDNIQVFQAKMDWIAKKIASCRLPAVNRNTYKEIVILIVDDMPQILKSIEGILNEKYKGVYVTNGEDAIKAADDNKPSLFLMDIQMPDTNGLELAKIFRKKGEFRKTPIIFLTDHASRDYVKTAKEIGNCDYLLKPIVKRRFLEKIESVFVSRGIM